MTNEAVRNRIQNATGVHDDLLTMVKKRKLRWYGHISRFFGMASSAGDSEKSKKERMTEEEMERKHLGMDRSLVWSFPEGSRRQGRVERYLYELTVTMPKGICCNVICGAPRPPRKRD